jgi:hypothetical protein
LARFLPLQRWGSFAVQKGEAKVRAIFLGIGIACLAWVCFVSAASAIPTPEDELAGILKMLLAKDASTECFLSVQRSCGGKPCEGFSVSYGTVLPALQPNQLRMYSEECGAGAAARKPVSTSMPHELLAQAFANLLPPATGLYDWAALQKLLEDAK